MIIRKFIKIKDDKRNKGYIKKELTIVFYSCRIQLTSTDVENKILGESTMKTKFMTLMTVATLGIFSAATVMAAGNNDFYTQPPAGSEWEKADTEGTYASYTNGNDYVNIYKYSLEDVKTGIAKCNDTYDACYQTIYSEGNSLYMAVGYAKDADDISDVRKFVEYISYPGNPHLPDRRTKTRPMILLIRQLQILTVRSQEEIQIPPIQKKMLLQNPRTAMMIPISFLPHQ